MNSALNEHPVVSETMRAYNSLISLKDNMIELLEDEDYGEEAELLKRTRSLEFEKVLDFLTDKWRFC